ncbi:hypothetical protein D031_4616B, partial [Vibrio parahaemolyticus VP-48]
MNICKE